MIGRPIFKICNHPYIGQMLISGIMCCLDANDSFLYGLFLSHNSQSDSKKSELATLTAVYNDIRALPITANMAFFPPGGTCAFEPDYAAMRDQARPFAEELAAKVFHPSRVAVWIAQGCEEDMM